MRLIGYSALGAMMIGGVAVAQQHERLPAECRQEIVALCRGTEGGALRSAGAAAKIVAVPGESHSSLNKGLRDNGDFATAEVDHFLADLR